ncbi:MAG TPA: hypothetical protein VHR45_02495 [Thermoanaerobaculia bacterium]|nr:hypothetical protein [Thermoanaerobaculia bacterium]
MGYQLTDFGAGTMSEIDLTAQEYLTIKKARDGVILISEIEDKFDLFVENFATLELTLLEAALRNSLFRDDDHASMMHTRQLFNRQLVNLLSAAYLYTEQLKVDAAKGFGRDFLNRLNEKVQAQRSEHLAFRFIEALRHHAQHRSLPVVGVRVNHHAERNTPKFHLRVSAEALIDIKELSADKKFDKTISSDLAQRSDHEDDFDIMPFVREYMQATAIVHDWLRGETRDELDCWKRTIHEAIERVTVISTPDAIVAMVSRSDGT